MLLFGAAEHEGVMECGGVVGGDEQGDAGQRQHQQNAAPHRRRPTSPEHSAGSKERVKDEMDGDAYNDILGGHCMKSTHQIHRN